MNVLDNDPEGQEIKGEMSHFLSLSIQRILSSSFPLRQASGILRRE